MAGGSLKLLRLKDPGVFLSIGLFDGRLGDLALAERTSLPSAAPTPNGSATQALRSQYEPGSKLL